MKRKAKISRILLYSVLLVAVIATWIAVTVLRIEEPESQSGDSANFRETTLSLTREIHDARNEDLALFSSIEHLEPGRPPEPSGTVATGANARTSMLSRNDRLLAGLGENSGHVSGRRVLYPSGALTAALDTVDALYAERIENQVEVQIPVLNDSMSGMVEQSMQLFGYRRLYKTLDLREDLFGYRDLRSLELRKIKYDIYFDLCEQIEEARNAERARVRAEVEALENGVIEDYDSQLDALLDQIAYQVLNSDESSEVSEGLKSLQVIRDSISEFSTSQVSTSSDIDHPDWHVTDMTDWVDSENNLTSTAENLISDDGSE